MNHGTLFPKAATRVAMATALSRSSVLSAA